MAVTCPEDAIWITLVMSDLVQGIIHVHSDFSGDGFHSVGDLADFARQSGMRFVGLTDHAEDLLREDMEELCDECERQSDESCVLIPGLEFQCDEDIHILGLGLTEKIENTDPIVVAKDIQGLGGLAILAHPGRNGCHCPVDLYSVLNGIEIWNAAYDGRFVPPMANIGLLREARDRNPTVLAFGGADLHCLDQPPGVMLQPRQNGSRSVNRDTVLDDLRKGGFSIRGRYISFDANTASHRPSKLYLWTLRKLYEISSAVRSGVLGES